MCILFHAQTAKTASTMRRRFEILDLRTCAFSAAGGRRLYHKSQMESRTQLHRQGFIFSQGCKIISVLLCVCVCVGGGGGGGGRAQIAPKYATWDKKSPA